MSRRPWKVRIPGILTCEFVAFCQHVEGGPELRIRWRRDAEPRCDLCGRGYCEHARAAIRTLRQDFKMLLAETDTSTPTTEGSI